jgi:hypothetical protein
MRVRHLLAVVGLLMLVLLPQAHAVSNIPGFEITGSISVFHFEPPVNAGVKTPVTKLKAAILTACITGVGVNCNSTNLETDGGGKAYIFLESIQKAWIATNNTCTNATEMDGLVGGDGAFMFKGFHAKSQTEFIVQGKVTFISGTFSPTAIKKASIMAVSQHVEHYAVGTFSTVGTVFGVPPGSCAP